MIIPRYVILFLRFILKVGQCEWKPFWLLFEFQSTQVISINALKICCHCDSPIKHLVNHIKLKFPILLFKCLPLRRHEKKKIQQCHTAQNKGNSCLSLSNYSDNQSLISREFHYSCNDMPGTWEVLNKWQILFIFERQIVFLICYSYYFPLPISLFIFPQFHFPNS